MRLFAFMGAIMLVFSLGACGDNASEFTKRDAWTGLSESFCERYHSTECAGGEFDEEAYQQCVDHNVYHGCELDDTCGELAVQTEEELLSCTEALDVQSCVYFIYGIVPEECTPFLN